MSTPRLSTPITDALSEAWFAATREHRLLIQKCDNCAHLQFYPRSHCVACGGTVQWLQAQGTGRLHTFSVVYRTPNEEFAELAPYIFAIVELDEGPRLTTRLVDVDLDDVHCDMPVEVVFTPDEGTPFVFPLFTHRPAN